MSELVQAKLSYQSFGPEILSTMHKGECSSLLSHSLNLKLFNIHFYYKADIRKRLIYPVNCFNPHEHTHTKTLDLSGLNGVLRSIDSRTPKSAKSVECTLCVLMKLQRIATINLIIPCMKAWMSRSIQLREDCLGF